MCTRATLQKQKNKTRNTSFQIRNRPVRQDSKQNIAHPPHARSSRRQGAIQLSGALFGSNSEQSPKTYSKKKNTTQALIRHTGLPKRQHGKVIATPPRSLTRDKASHPPSCFHHGSSRIFSILVSPYAAVLGAVVTPAALSLVR